MKYHPRSITNLRRYRRYLKSKKWAKIRMAMFRNYGFACGLCGSKKQIQVHHRTYKNQYNEKPEDLIVLCHKCHEYLTFKENYRRSNVEAE